jgi:hypothetical protein
MQLQDSQCRVIADSKPRQLGWALAGRDVVQCSICRELRPPAWKGATICRYDFIGDFEKAWRQRQEQARAAFAAEKAA